MKILLIYPPIEHQAVYSKDFRRVKGAETSAYPPLGLMYLQAMIKRETGFTVKLLDLTLPRNANLDLPSFLRQFRPDVVGMTAYTLCFYDVLQVARAVKSVASDIKVVIGGPHGELYPEESMLHREIDFVVVGDGERPFLELVRSIDRGDEDYAHISSLYYRDSSDRVIKNSRAKVDKDLDALPFPCRDDLDETGYFNPFFAERRFSVISTSRGCPFSCTFCDVTDKVFRARTTGNVIAEIEQTVKHEGIRSFFIVDDLFNVSKARVSEFCDRVIEKELDIRWIFRGRVDQIDELLLARCAEAGCIHIIFGIEDFSDLGLKLIKKKITTSRAITVLNQVRHAGIKTTANFIIGFPHHESEADVLKINDFIKRLNPDYVQLGILIPFPGSQIFDEGVARQIIDASRWSEYIRNPVPIFELPLWEEHLSLEQLTRLYEGIMKRFYFSPGNLLKRMFEIRTWHQFCTYCRVGWATLLMGRRRRGQANAISGK